MPHQRQLLETQQHKQIAVQDTIATLTETNQLELNPVRILLKDEDDLNDEEDVNVDDGSIDEDIIQHPQHAEIIECSSITKFLQIAEIEHCNKKASNQIKFPGNK